MGDTGALSGSRTLRGGTSSSWGFPGDVSRPPSRVQFLQSGDDRHLRGLALPHRSFPFPSSDIIFDFARFSRQVKALDILEIVLSLQPFISGIDLLHSLIS